MYNHYPYAANRAGLSTSPDAIRRERLDIAHVNALERLPDQLERATSRLARCIANEAEKSTASTRQSVERARARLEHYTAAAIRAGIIPARKEPQ